MKSLLFGFLVLFCCVLNTSAQKKSILAANAQPDRYQVYKVVLTELFIKPETKKLAIRSFTSKHRSSNSRKIEKHNLTGLVQGNSTTKSDLVDKYLASQYKRDELKNEFELEIPILLLNEEDLGATLKKLKKVYPKDQLETKLNEIYKQRYKGPAVTFSTISFNRAKNQALLHVEFGGLGQYVFLIKESNAWIIKKSFVSWVS